jgi:hypothetical protein
MMKAFKLLKDCELTFEGNRRLRSNRWVMVIDSRISRVIKNESEYIYKYEYLIDFEAYDTCIWINCDEYSEILACSEFVECK